MVSLVNDFIVDVRVLNCEHLENIKLFVFKLINRISKRYHIDISPLQRVIVTDKYYDVVVQFYHERGRKGAPTRNEYSRGVAKISSDLVNGQLGITLFIDYVAMFENIEDDEKMRASYNIIHHELCHIEDAARKFRIDASVTTHDKSFAEYFLVNTAESMWDEYYANRKSVQSMPSALDRDVCLLLSMAEIHKNINRHVTEYRVDSDLDKVIARCFPDIRQKLICMARVAGSKDGLEVSLDQIQDEIFMKFKTSEEYDIFLKSAEILMDMYENINKWKIPEVYVRLLDVVEKYVNMMGFYFHIIDESSAYIEIPFRSDNIPF